VANLDAQLRLSSDVLRHMIVQLPKGIPERSFLLEAYVAPLSEEDEENRKAKRFGDSAAPTKATATVSPEAEPMIHEEKPISMEDLDKKLDEILDVNISENI
jgi:hypothetical protein